MLKVLKFGGTSVGTVDSLRNVKCIVESLDSPAVIVVSALGGITDRLIATAKMASSGDMEGYRDSLAGIIRRHDEVIDGIVIEKSRDEIRKAVHSTFDELESLYYGIYLVNDLSERVLDRVVSFGERLSSTIISRVIEGVELVDSREFIKTVRRHGRNVLDSESTDRLLDSVLSPRCGGLTLVPGFISTDSDGVVTNLGRGGSDYTAAIIAAHFNADVLEIWTDVDGFMTADPRKISKARIIDRMSFVEAMELCNFGAKVIYPPTIYPVFHKNIPIYIKNTFNPDAPGTLIDEGSNRVNVSRICGISSITDTCLITVKPTGDNADPNHLSGRVFNAMARIGVDVFMSSLMTGNQAISFATRNADAERAKDELLLEFAPEIAKKQIETPQSTHDLATVALVAESMDNCDSVLRDVAESLSHAHIEIIAASRGNSGSNVAVVVPLEHERQALQVIHDKLFN